MGQKLRAETPAAASLHATSDSLSARDCKGRPGANKTVGTRAAVSSAATTGTSTKTVASRPNKVTVALLDVDSESKNGKQAEE